MNLSLQHTLSVPIGSLEAYIHQVNQIPMLTAEEELAYATRLQEEGDVESARQLVLPHLRYVVRVARSYLGYGLPLGDLIQEGNVGLMKAVKRFDPAVGVRLVSFAVHWIKAEIHEFVLKNWRIVKIATTKAQRKLFFNLRQMKKRLGWCNEDEIKTIAEDLGVTVQDVLQMEQRMNANDASFSAQATDDEDKLNVPERYLHDPEGDPAWLIESEDSRFQNHEKLQLALARLDARSQEILQQRWLLEDQSSTLHSLAAQYNISAERVRQLEKNALNKLRQYMEELSA